MRQAGCDRPTLCLATATGRHVDPDDADVGPCLKHRQTDGARPATDIEQRARRGRRGDDGRECSRVVGSVRATRSVLFMDADGCVGEECDCHGSVSGGRGAIGARGIGCALTGERQGEYTETGASSRRGRRLPGASVGGNRTAAALVRELRPQGGPWPALIHQVVLGLRLEPPRGGAATHTYTCTETLPCPESAQDPLLGNLPSGPFYRP